MGLSKAKPFVGSELSRLTARAERVNAPLSALFELTGRCNLDCGHCYLDIAHPPPELTTAEATAIIDQLADAGTLFLTLTGGELFLRRDAIEIASHARGRGLALRLFTNATRITRPLAAEIAALHPLGVEVSIYGSHGAAHASVTQRRSSLRRTLRGVLLLKQAGVRVGLKAPLLSTVTGELDALSALAARLEMPISFDPFVTPRLDGALTPLATRASTDALATALTHPAVNLSPTLPPPLDADQSPCAIARRTTRIDCRGDLYPCPTYPEPVGNLREQAFATLWADAPLLKRLREVRVRDLRGSCSGCAKSSYCGRCSAVALIEHGDDLGPAEEACRIAEAKERAIEGAPREGGVPARVRLRVL